MTPTDLVPLPTMPYDERPAALPLDVEECRTALWMVRGNVTKAAQLLKTEPRRLRVFIKGSKRLQSEQEEAKEQLLDVAEDVAYEALTDGVNPSRRDSMARYIMNNLGAERGYGNNDGNGGVNINLPKHGKMEITWGDGTNINNPPDKVIEHESR